MFCLWLLLLLLFFFFVPCFILYFFNLLLKRVEFGTYLKEIGRVGAAGVENFDTIFMRMPWNNTNGLDCAVFVMKHMELFNGEVFSEPKLKQVLDCSFVVYAFAC